MTSANGTTLPRSNYARKLLDFPTLVFPDQAAFQFSGKWRDFFRQRIGPKYDGRVICEIGCFDAAYLSRIAAKYPNAGFVGLDWKCKPIYDGAQRIAGSGVRNLVLLRGRGQDISRMFAPRELDEIWIFHPDPCARDAELPTRLIGEPFLLEIHEILRDADSLLAIKTDHPGYFQSILGLFGLPEPVWFQTARNRKVNGTAKGDAGFSPPYPRVRVGDLMPAEAIDGPSEMLRRLFKVAMHSADFWHDAAALAHTTDRYFSGEATAFETRFIAKRFPIYYFEVRGLRDIPRCVPSKP